ncbi:hypothetical protein [Cytobacillus gottheilii]|uniref:TrbC/VIRB2 family protein n=1 Tax=Cytobacillus gottheilii TaxID=859144 RepID=A0ABX8FBH9_9BACI|nr:hypothetical protein [Cytobacillus gottheilii]QVY60907.1 hypothetical protein J1899_18325 [Cytobacillus gottheilii]
MKTQTMSISAFMSGSYKKEKPKKKYGQLARRIGTSIAIPLIAAKPAFAATPEAVPVAATQFIGEKTLEVIAHALDPLIDLMVALSFPVCSIIIVGSCFFFMLGKSERGWSGIQNAGLGYVLIQIMPMLLGVLKEIGSAI